MFNSTQTKLVAYLRNLSKPVQNIIDVSFFSLIYPIQSYVKLSRHPPVKKTCISDSSVVIHKRPVCDIGGQN